MTDIHDLRAQMREGRGVRPVVVHGGGFRIPFGLMAGAAVVIGFLVVLFTPKIYSVQRTAALPAFKEARQEPAPVRSRLSLPAQPRRRRGAAARRVGCRRRRNPATPARARTRPPGSPTRCASNASSRAAARAGGGRGEAALFPQRGDRAVLHGQPGAQGDRRYHQLLQGDRVHQHGDDRGREAAGPVPLAIGRHVPAADPLTPDPRVAEAIEGLMRAGYLNRGHREDIAANVPRDYKDASRASSASRRRVRRRPGGRSGSSFLRVILSENRFPTFSDHAYFPSAASISLTASSLAHSAGPASTPSSQPCGSISSVVGMPNALPAAFRS